MPALLPQLSWVVLVTPPSWVSLFYSPTSSMVPSLSAYLASVFSIGHRKCLPHCKTLTGTHTHSQSLLCKVDETEDKYEGAIRMCSRQNSNREGKVTFKTSATIFVFWFSLSPTAGTDNMINYHLYLKLSPLPFICKWACQWPVFNTWTINWLLVFA